MFDRRTFMASSAATAALASTRINAADIPTETVRVDTRALTGPLHHVWEESVGSDRAAITLREEWRQDLRRGVDEAGFKRVRCHGIFNDELGVYGNSVMEMMRRNAAPDWMNIYRVYDGFLENGVSPFVELSFMPGKLASGKTEFGFYGANITPPKSDEEYAKFIRDFTTAMIDRYGLETVLGWHFEVWNEPNLSFFWTADQQRYFEMYKAAATAIKSVDRRLMVGGPATSKTAWIGEFGQWCAANNTPIDFFTTHVYAGDDQKEVFKDGRTRTINDVIPEALANARATIDSGPFSGKPMWLSEWSSDSPAMITHTIANSMEYCAGMSQWVLSGMYEELGVDDYTLKEGSMGWTMMINGIAKPAFNTYKLMHRLGTQRLAAQGPALASRTRDGKTALLVWNLADVPQPGGIPGMSAERNVKGQTKRIKIAFDGLRGRAAAHVSYVDWERGSPMPAWRAMGSPRYPSLAQVEQLRKISQPVTELRHLDRDGTLTLELPPEGIALIELA